MFFCSLALLTFMYFSLQILNFSQREVDAETDHQQAIKKVLRAKRKCVPSTRQVELGENSKKYRHSMFCLLCGQKLYSFTSYFYPSRCHFRVTMAHQWCWQCSLHCYPTCPYIIDLLGRIASSTLPSLVSLVDNAIESWS